jgi:hypothetical protein
VVTAAEEKRRLSVEDAERGCGERVVARRSTFGAVMQSIAVDTPHG